jgi:glucose-1-phosphate cytidylyltransferase
MLTYGDGLADIDLKALLDFHHAHGKLATVTTVHSPARFGRISFTGDQILEFYEKPQHSEGWINGGFFVLNRCVTDYVDGDDTIWERDPVERLTHDRQLAGYRHSGFWSCMDTLKEKNMLEEMWNTGNAPWKIWETK